MHDDDDVREVTGTRFQKLWDVPVQMRPNVSDGFACCPAQVTDVRSLFSVLVYKKTKNIRGTVIWYYSLCEGTITFTSLINREVLAALQWNAVRWFGIRMKLRSSAGLSTRTWTVPWSMYNRTFLDWAQMSGRCLKKICLVHKSLTERAESRGWKQVRWTAAGLIMSQEWHEPPSSASMAALMVPSHRHRNRLFPFQPRCRQRAASGFE